MHCPFCQAEDTRVMDSRLAGEGESVRRRRECIACNERFTTYETAELSLPRIVKRDKRRVAFDQEKLRHSLLVASEKRPINTEQIDSIVEKIKHMLRSSGESEISTRKIGDWVMQDLRALDEVAYIRFASVYLGFEDLDAFREEIERLLNHQKSANN